MAKVKIKMLIKEQPFWICSSIQNQTDKQWRLNLLYIPSRHCSCKVFTIVDKRQKLKQWKHSREIMLWLATEASLWKPWTVTDIFPQKHHGSVSDGKKQKPTFNFESLKKIGNVDSVSDVWYQASTLHYTVYLKKQLLVSDKFIVKY